MQMTEILIAAAGKLGDFRGPLSSSAGHKVNSVPSKPAQMTEGSQPPMLRLKWFGLVHKINQLSVSISSTALNPDYDRFVLTH